ncbi:riboflavin synthase [Candidatus Parcubacteria bacterium]|nr:MAG: riboflavin synthase [Candidatus Parcubacteria bacterium]
MFSGIIEEQATIAHATMEGKCKRVQVQKPRGWKLSLGESVSIDGICSTVAAIGKYYFYAEYMPETLSKTTAASFEKNRMVNLERSLRFGDRIHGHFVAGHVDATTKILHIEKNGRSRRISFALPRSLSRYVVERGSVAINGVSLTVAAKDGASFMVALIPHTLKITNLGALKKGDAVNIECDMLARYGSR